MRAMEAQIHALGGADYIVQRVADGETILGIAMELGWSRDLLSNWLNAREETGAALRVARARSAAAMAEHSVILADTAPPEHAPKTRLQIESRRWLASRYDPETFADRPNVAVNVTIAGLHMESLRRRPVQALPDPQVIDIEPLMD
jgi:hypothetical protein